MKRLTRSALFLLLCLTLCLVLSPTAFAADPGLVIPDSTTVIEAEAFAGDTALTSVTIPAGVTEIRERAFYGCTNIKDVYYSGTVEQWDEIAIQSGNGPLTRASLHCYTNPDDFYIELTYSNVFNPKEWNYKAAQKFADMVTERTEGHIRITYHGLNEFDCYRDSVVHAVNGDNWIGLEDPSLFAEWVGDCAVLVGPMLYQNEAEYNYVMNSTLVDNIKTALSAENIHVLDTHYSFGFRSFITNKYIASPVDLSGVKIRSTTASLFIKTIEAMGGTPVPMSFSECLSAISSGLIDGFEGSTYTLAGAGAPYELVKNVAETKHFIATRWLFMSEEVYQSIPLKWRTVLDDCAVSCGIWEQDSCAAEEAVLIERLKNEEGVVYNSVDVDAFTNACDSVFDWIVEEYNADPSLFGQIVNLVKEYRGDTPAPSPENPVTLTYADANFLDGTLSGEMAKAFKYKVEALSNGSLKIDLQGSGVLGDEKTVLANLAGGGTVCDLCHASASALSVYGCDKASLLAIPYTFADRDHYSAFVNSELAAQFLNEPQEIGLPMRGLCYGEEGFRHFFFNRRVRNLDDMENLKIRVSSDPIMTGMVTNLGASATSVPFSELYSALNTGVVDGAEQPIANYRSNLFQNVAPFLLLDGHIISATQILISDTGWAKLNEQQQEWITQAAQYASQVSIQKSAAYEEAALTELQSEGVTVITVSDKTPYRTACEPTIRQYTAGQETLYQQILALQ